MGSSQLNPMLLEFPCFSLPIPRHRHSVAFSWPTSHMPMFFCFAKHSCCILLGMKTVSREPLHGIKPKCVSSIVRLFLWLNVSRSEYSCTKCFQPLVKFKTYRQLFFWKSWSTHADLDKAYVDGIRSTDAYYHQCLRYISGSRSLKSFVRSDEDKSMYLLWLPCSYEECDGTWKYHNLKILFTN